ncbi:MAG: hypothetical protein COU22_02985 [Candidatus Komeilibacteria bacterium CG10_big_fil_rev_8_21_14_0_10_41_13]|uniref:Nudix hydrolase domain-containing protein n=1 Tax=Candidatus Komeilibacteria bacterium CG10_big_fil_rev_8_21_14_0_10_41_13 TaxID=1974476 RepID=A0A2M6WC65_9BACT|nr:MAG: hypothetical protein COU22_02985 [Candidatus Komeilibacteria bacterium CG10_big_fil_rev_8_21_14_0_10_41_13]
MVFKKRQVSKVIIINNQGNYLLQLRDGNPCIDFPFHWTLVGGVVDAGEDHRQAIVRELREELGLIYNELDYFMDFQFNNTVQHIYILKDEIKVSKIDLSEGVSVKWFTYLELRGIKIAFNYHDIIRRFHNGDRFCPGSGSRKKILSPK